MRIGAWVHAASMFLLAVAQGAVAGDSQGQVSLALVGGRVIDGYGGAPLERAVVLIAGNRIAQVGLASSVAIPPGARTIDVSGMTLLPGLWESSGHLMHIGESDSGQLQEKYAARLQELMASVARTSLLAGITSFRDTANPLEAQLALRADIEAGRTIGPRLYLSGQPLRQRSADVRLAGGCKLPYCVSTAQEAHAAAQKLVAQGVDQIVASGYWDVPILKEVTAVAHAAGIGVDATPRHVLAYRNALQAGVDRMHHIFTVDALSDYSDEDMRLLIRGAQPDAPGIVYRGPYILPTQEMRRIYVRYRSFPGQLDHPRFKKEFPAEVYEHLRQGWADPASLPWGFNAEERVAAAQRKLQQFIKAGGREQLVAGTDAGTPLNVHPAVIREIRNLHAAGLTPMEAIQSATMRPAQMQGVLDKSGTISAGKLADIIVVDGDPLYDLSVLEHRLVLVVKDGTPHQPERHSIVVQ